MKRLMKRLILATIATLSFAGAYAIDDPVQYVNPLVGSHSTGGLSTGNTYPAIALPWGMNFWTTPTMPRRYAASSRPTSQAPG